MKTRYYWIIGIIIILIWMLIELNFLKDESSTEKFTDEDLLLMNKIKEEAAHLYIKPIDAKVDHIWKAIPGYNGLSVDIERTFYFAKKLKGNIPFVYNEISPKINIEQLGPQPIYKGNPQKPMVSIMVNVAWGNEYLPSILKTLEHENVRTTFFLDGTWLKNNVQLAKEIQKQGHELSNHAYSHKNMSQLGWTAAKEEIGKTQQLLERYLGIENKLFAPPSGDFDDETLKLAHQLNLKTILWTIDTVDWKNPEPSWILKKISARVEPGSLILMHPTRSSSAALSGMIRDIKSKGLAIGTVSELISPDRIVEVETIFDF